MNGRCFDVSGNRWKTVEEWKGEPEFVFWQGFSAEVRDLLYIGWKFYVITNNFTRHKKVVGVFWDDCYIASGHFHSKETVLHTLSVGKKIWRLREDLFENIKFSELETVHLMELLEERLKAEIPIIKSPPSEPSAEILQIAQRLRA